MNKEIYNINEGITQIKKHFNLTDELYDEFNNGSTEFIQSYYNKTMDKNAWHLYKFLDYLLPDLQTYWQFGIDKAGVGVTDFTSFCNDLDIDLQNIQTDSNRKLFILINKQKTLLFYVTNLNYKSGYFHSFNAVGESNEIIKTFMVYKKYNKIDDDMCWGGPW